MNKNTLFSDSLVICGQSVLTLSLLYPQSSDARDNVLHDLWDALHLACCYLRNPANEDIDPLRHALDDWMSLFKRTVPGKMLILYVAGSRVQPSLLSVTELHKKMASAVAGVHRAIGYASSLRTTWLKQHQVSIPECVVSTSLHKWKTFPKNDSWVPFANYMLEGATHEPHRARIAQFLRDKFASDPGRGALSVLRAKLYVVLNQTQLSVAADASDLLPAEISVKSEVGGSLAVCAEFNPRKHLPVLLLQQLESKTGPEMTKAQRDMLKIVRFKKLATVSTLAAVVKEAQAWLLEQRANCKPIEAMLQELATAKEIAEVRQKLEKTFSPREQTLLLKLLAGTAD